MSEEDESGAAVEEEGNSLSAALEAAWDDDQAGGDDDGSIDTGGSVADGSGRAGVTGAVEEPAAAGQADPGSALGAEGDADIQGIQGGEEPLPGAQEAAPSAGAPVSWNPAAREQWKDIPKEAQEYIAQREAEFETGIQKYAQQANRANAMDKVLQPFGQYFATNGGAGATLRNLLETGATLQGGSPIQKAQRIAELIQKNGVDIGTLDNLLVGREAPAGVQQTSEVQQAVNEAIAPFQQFIGGMQQQQQQQYQGQQQEVRTSVDAFAADPKHEFYNDVAGDMADILDMAANRNMVMSMDQAYERACMLNPEITKIQTNRAAATAAANKRHAGSSISGGPGGGGGTPEAGSISEALELAWDQAGQV